MTIKLVTISCMTSMYYSFYDTSILVSQNNSLDKNEGILVWYSWLVRWKACFFKEFLYTPNNASWNVHRTIRFHKKKLLTSKLTVFLRILWFYHVEHAYVWFGGEFDRDWRSFDTIISLRSWTIFAQTEKPRNWTFQIEDCLCEKLGQVYIIWWFCIVQLSVRE